MMALHRVSSRKVVLRVVLAAAATACNSDGGTAPRDEENPAVPQLATFLVSGPSAATAAAGSRGTLGDMSDGDTYAYVSASPGSSPGVIASITNRSRDRQSGRSSGIEVPVTEGGFDPVPIPASSGDTLHVEFLGTDRSVLLVAAAVVPKLRPPKIVRTNPRPGKKDVPLNARLVIVFNEPLDPATITPDNIGVIAGGAAISGTLMRTNDFTVEFVPAEPLRPETSHQIVVRTGLRNLSGVALESEFSASFETGTSSSETPPPEPVPPEEPVTFVCPADTQCIAFTRQGEVFTTSHDSPAVRLLEDASRPAWSRDGLMIAFTRPDRRTLAKWQICIAEHDGSHIRCVVSEEDGTVVGGPSWSPDGIHVAFSVFAYSCPNGQCGQLGGSFSRVKLLDTRTMEITSIGTHEVQSLAWSPDGRKIAYAAWATGQFGRGGLHLMNADGSGIQFIGQALVSHSVSGIAWSPDGGRLGLALRNENACPWYCDTALGIVNADGSALQVLETAKTAFQDPEAIERYIDFPAWSPDGSLLTYTHWGWCYDIDPGCFAEIRASNVATGVNYLLVPGANYGSWR
jgi:hypothetical protein